MHEPLAPFWRQEVLPRPVGTLYIDAKVTNHDELDPRTWARVDLVDEVDRLREQVGTLTVLLREAEEDLSILKLEV